MTNVESTRMGDIEIGDGSGFESGHAGSDLLPNGQKPIGALEVAKPLPRQENIRAMEISSDAFSTVRGVGVIGVRGANMYEGPIVALI